MLEGFIERQYWKGMSKKVEAGMLKEMQSRYPRIREENQHWATDRPTAFNLMFASLVLASFQVMRERGVADWEDILRYSLIERTRKQQQLWMKLYLLIDRSPFRRIVWISKTKQVKHYGKEHFTHEIVKDTGRSYHLHIKKCFFFSFFRSNQALEVMPLFCAMDDVWGVLLKSGKHGVSFRRPQLLSKGDAHCFFEFEKL
ncbi:L-2-amino-thiazoline-4-carboxylic acid hydrolase [Ectobacillus ponti]|uniref:L-2-amino-thiazoline-4-carboxylic acid hydrolase n=1 Tax=Ectobacillus ponti TaxID=2961894 RepID=A0AA42BP09_9BACI|nr:L-2-amino-thiazoline-4-carboxylic acid hydrolase [Ectobacillus ponti]MCP8967916.1 L-2-amino-thiazoline-4-carboxylic acid hydrolase [Ectobacillus ponti]